MLETNVGRCKIENESCIQGYSKPERLCCRRFSAVCSKNVHEQQIGNIFWLINPFHFLPYPKKIENIAHSA